MSSSLESYRGRDFVGVEELAHTASVLIERYDDEPARGNVRMTITPRIVRHYLAEDLLGEPTGHSGTSTVFNYGNLLRLLAVKRLLADHWSVVKIKEFMTALDITALEQLVGGALTRASNCNAPMRTDAARESFKEVRRTHELSTAQLTPVPPHLASLAIESAHRHASQTDTWVELATGLEIRVRRSFRPPRTERERERLAKRFWAIIKSRDEG